MSQFLPRLRAAMHDSALDCLLDPSTWATVTAACAAGLVYAPERWHDTVGTVAMLSAVLGTVLRGSAPPPKGDA